jgi:hypothetical protein
MQVTRFAGYYAIYSCHSFGNPDGKTIVVVSLNPSSKEHITGFLVYSSDIEDLK